VSWFSSLVTLICIVLLTSIILLPEGGVRKFSSYQFPSVIDLPGWQLEKSEPLSLAEIGQSMTNPEAENETPLTEQEVLVYQNNQKQTNTILAGQRYFYHQLNTVVVATLKYVVNADGSFPGSRNKNFSEFDLTAFSKQRDQSLKKQDQFLLFTGDSTTHLLSCITPRGNSVVNSTALILSDRIRHTLLNPLSLYHWVRGEKLMWDRRCLWIHLKAEGQSPQTESQWQSIWELLLYYWRINFPVF
jgi:cyanosortase A-associated protein